MKADAGRTAVLLGLTLAGVLFWPPSRVSWAIGCWVLAAVYALATNPRRWL